MKGNETTTALIPGADGGKGVVAVENNRQVLRTVFEDVIRACPGLFYEKEVTSFDELVKAVRVLDEDSGVRLIGERNGRECLVFITRFGERFTMMTYSVVKKTGAPGRRVNVAEFSGINAIVAALRRVSPGRIHAYVY